MPSSVSSRSHKHWYDDPSLTISEYCRHPDNPPPRVRFTTEELDFYTNKHVKYQKLMQEQNDAMAHNHAEIFAAHARAQVILESELQNATPTELCTYADIQATLDDLEKKMERTPTTFDDRILLTTYAGNYIMLMDMHVLNHPARRGGDLVFGMAAKQLDPWFASKMTGPAWEGASLKMNTQTIELIPADMRRNAQSVTPSVLQGWKNNLPTLVGVGFINTSSDNIYATENSVFFVRDFATTTRGSCYFNVEFEDSGQDVFDFSPDDLFELIATAVYVRVEDAP
ncbi:hypothetical protein B0H34DRAFT_799167 [Crassisporium funariophilum]|nr:hypothetical protein B0H34DRAFT_799167 [Crassisporium funariophilum]